MSINDQRKRAMAKKLIAACGGSVRGKTVGLFGLALKPRRYARRALARAGGRRRAAVGLRFGGGAVRGRLRLREARRGAGDGMGHVPRARF